MQISVNLRQQIAKMCCKSSSMWKCSTSSSGQQQEQYDPVTTTHRTQSHGHKQQQHKNRNNKLDYIHNRRQHSLGTICLIAVFILIAIIQMQSVTGLREGLSGEWEQ